MCWVLSDFEIVKYHGDDCFFLPPLFVESKSKEAENYTTMVKFKTVYNLANIFIVFLHVRRKVVVFDDLGVIYKHTKQFTIIRQI